MSDARSPLATKILDANPHAYQALVVKSPTPPLAKELLGKVRAEELLARPVNSTEAANALLAGLWLWHDGLEECHHIVQNSPAGEMGRAYSFWHAILHRREGDFSNSKYWYARAAGHPSLATIGASAGGIVDRAPADKSLLRVVASGWNPNAFVDLVESLASVRDDPRVPIAVQLQQLEWRILWEHCLRAA